MIINGIFCINWNFSSIKLIFELCMEPETANKSGRWLTDEYDLFVQYYDVYGKDWKAIASQIKTRTPEQVRSHAQKYLAKKLRKEKQLQQVKEATEMIPDSLDKRLTRKKIQKINYKEKDACFDPFFLQLKTKKVIKKEKDAGKEVKKISKINVCLQTDPQPEQPPLPFPPSHPYLYYNPWLYGNGGCWIP